MYEDKDSGEVCGWNSRWVQGGGRITSILGPFLLAAMIDRLTNEVIRYDVCRRNCYQY